MRRLCRYACRPEGCYQRNLFHLERFAHPGDEEWPVLISSDDEAFGEPALGSPAGSSPGEPVPADRCAKPTTYAVLSTYCTGAAPSVTLAGRTGAD